MASRFLHTLWAAGAVALLLSCGNTPSRSHGPIVLGDSSTIVTEADSQKLKDLVIDLQPVIPTSENKEEETKAPATDSAKAKPENTAASAASQPMPDGPGLKAEFKEVTIMIPGLNVKQGGKLNLEKANGAVYTLEGGEINGSTLRISGNITKVAQRYQTVVMMKNDMGTLLLNDLTVTAAWKQISGSGGSYKISGLDMRSLQQPDADASDIRNAATKAARQRRWSRKKIQELQSEIRHVRSINQKPFSFVLRSVMWKIDGKDASGRMFSKQIRVDIPL